MIRVPWAVTPTDRRNPSDSRAPARLPPAPKRGDVPAQRKAAGQVVGLLVLAIVAICTWRIGSGA